MKRAAFARINLAHLKHNLATIRRVAKQSKVMAVVKADAYGHGMLNVCKSLEDVDAFAVAFMNEAMELRESGIQQPIVALQGFSNAADLNNAITQNISVVVHHQEQLKILRTHSSSINLNVLIKIDTGMHRLGFAVDDFPSVLKDIQSILTRQSNIVLMTHLACADEMTNMATQQQLEQFDLLVKDLLFEQTIANSAGILAWPESHRNWVRPGLVLYGVNPIEERHGLESVDLRAVMSLHAPLISIKKCKKGEKIGYGGDFSCPNDMLIGIIAIGYADGYPRHLRHAPNVCIGSQIVPLVGRVSMDMVAVDLTGVNVHIGELAELWGESVAVTEVAKHAETISYELLCAAGNAVKKIYVQ